MPGCPRSLSTMTPSRREVSETEPPCFFVTWMLSSSTVRFPSWVSTTRLTAFTVRSARRAMCPLAGLPPRCLPRQGGARDALRGLEIIRHNLRGDLVEALVRLLGGEAVAVGDHGG